MTDAPASMTSFMILTRNQDRYASILCRPLDDGEELFRIFHGLDRCFNDLVRDILSLWVMWIGDVARNMESRLHRILQCPPYSIDIKLLALARPVTELFLIVSPIRFTASKSPLEAAGKPASMTSTPKRSSCFATSIFSSVLSSHPPIVHRREALYRK